jgi:hypothetical protein
MCGVLVLPVAVNAEWCGAARELLRSVLATDLPSLARDERSWMLRKPRRDPGNGVVHGPAGWSPRLTCFTLVEVAPRVREAAAAEPQRNHASNIFGGFRLAVNIGSGSTDALPELMPRNPLLQGLVDLQLLGPGTSVGNFDGSSVVDHADVSSGASSTGLIYCRLPNGAVPGEAHPGAESHGEGGEGALEKHDRAHFDGSSDERARLSMTCYIDDVGPRNGGMVVWPGSHTRMQRHNASRRSQKPPTVLMLNRRCTRYETRDSALTVVPMPFCCLELESD